MVGAGALVVVVARVVVGGCVVAAILVVGGCVAAWAVVWKNKADRKLYLV